MPYKSPKVYTLNIRAIHLIDEIRISTDYFFGNAGLAWSTSANLAKIWIPKSGTIRAVQAWFYAMGSGTAEDVIVVIRKNNTTDYAFLATLHLNAASVLGSSYTLNIPVAAGDYIEFKVTTPAWVTNPTAISTSGNVLIECD